MAYFDNAVTTYPKPECVYEAMNQFYRSCGGSAGRGEYGLAVGASRIVAETREVIKELLHCPLKQVVFTPTATLAMNMVLQGLISEGKKNIYINHCSAHLKLTQHCKFTTIVVQSLSCV